jgi:hypothetical protein
MLEVFQEEKNSGEGEFSRLLAIERLLPYTRIGEDMKDVEGKASLLYWSWDSEKHLPRFARIGHLLGNK